MKSEKDKGFILIESILFMLCASILMLCISTSLKTYTKLLEQDGQIQEQQEKELYEIYQE